MKLHYLFICLMLAFTACSKKVNHVHKEAVPDQYIVKTTNNTIVAGSGCKIVQKISEGYFLVDCKKGKKSLIQGADYVEPNYIWHAIGTEDPLYPKLWGLHGKEGVNAPKAWELTKGSKDIKVMVIDTGIDYTHPDLIDNMWVNEAEKEGEEGVDDDGNGCVDDVYGCDYANNDGDPMDDHSHGTHCAGTIGAVHNDIGVAGVMADVPLVGCKFLTKSGSGETANAIKCIDYGIKIGVDIMSNSWGGGGSSQALKEAIERARDAGIVFTAAAGNSGSDNDSRPHYPSNYDVENVVAVAAHQESGSLASFSCYGKETVDIAAPGKAIMSTIKGGEYKSYSGTSMATPHVSGVIGLLLAKEGMGTFAELKERLMETGVYKRVWKTKLLSGARIDAYNLLTDTRPPRPPKPDPRKWKTFKLKKAVETPHPYKDLYTKEWTVRVPKAKFVRVVVKKISTEKKYDVLLIKDASGTSVQEIDGKKENFKSEYVEGKTIKLKFKSDRSKTDWGFIVEELEYQ